MRSQSGLSRWQRAFRIRTQIVDEISAYGTKTLEQGVLYGENGLVDTPQSLEKRSEASSSIKKVLTMLMDLVDIAGEV